MSFLGLAGGKSFRGTESGLISQYITVRIQPTTHREFDVGSTERDAFIKNCLWQQFNLFIHQLVGKGKAFLIIEAEITETCRFGGRRSEGPDLQVRALKLVIRTEFSGRYSQTKHNRPDS